MANIAINLNLSSRTDPNPSGFTRTVPNAYQWVDTTQTRVRQGFTLSGDGYSLVTDGLIPDGNSARIELNNGTIFITSGDNNSVPNNLTGTHFEITNSTVIMTATGAGGVGTQVFQAGNGRNTQIILRNTTFRDDGPGEAPGLNIAGALPSGNDIAGLTLDGFWYNDIVGIAHIGSDFREAGTRPGVPYVVRCGRPASSNQNNSNTELTKWYAGVQWPTGPGDDDGLNCFNTNIGITNVAAQAEVWIIDPVLRVVNGVSNLPVNYHWNSGTFGNAPFVNLAYSHRPFAVTPLGIDINSDVVLKFNDSIYDIFNAVSGVDGVLDADGIPLRSLEASVRPVATTSGSAINDLGYYVRHQRERAGAAGGGSGTVGPSNSTFFAENTAISNATDAYIVSSIPYIVQDPSLTAHTFGFTNEGVDVTRGGAIINTRNIIMIEDPFIQGLTSEPSRVDVSNANDLYYQWKSDVHNTTALIDIGTVFTGSGSTLSTTLPIDFDASSSAITISGNTVTALSADIGDLFSISTRTAGTSIEAITTTSTMALRNTRYGPYAFTADTITLNGGVLEGARINGTTRVNVASDLRLDSFGEDRADISSPIVNALGRTVTVNDSRIATNDLDAEDLVLSNALIAEITEGQGSLDVTDFTSTGVRSIISMNSFACSTIRMTNGSLEVGSDTNFGGGLLQGCRIDVEGDITFTSLTDTGSTIDGFDVDLGSSTLTRTTVNGTGTVTFGFGGTQNDVTLTAPSLSANNNILLGGTYTTTISSSRGVVLSGTDAADFPTTRVIDFDCVVNGVLNITAPTGTNRFVVLGPDFMGPVTVNAVGGGNIYLVDPTKPILNGLAFDAVGRRVTLGTNVMLEPISTVATATIVTAPTRAQFSSVGSHWRLYGQTNAQAASNNIGTLITDSETNPDYVSAGVMDLHGPIDPTIVASIGQTQTDMFWPGTLLPGLGTATVSRLYLVSGNGRSTRIRHVGLNVPAETVEFVTTAGLDPDQSNNTLSVGYRTTPSMLNGVEVRYTMDNTVPPASTLVTSSEITIGSIGSGLTSRVTLTGYSPAEDRRRAKQPASRALFANARTQNNYLELCAVHLYRQHETEALFQRTLPTIFQTTTSSQVDYEPLSFSFDSVLIRGTGGNPDGAPVPLDLPFLLDGGLTHEAFENILLARDDGVDTLLNQRIEDGTGILFTSRDESANAIVQYISAREDPSDSTSNFTMEIVNVETTDSSSPQDVAVIISSAIGNVVDQAGNRTGPAVLPILHTKT